MDYLESDENRNIPSDFEGVIETLDKQKKMKAYIKLSIEKHNNEIEVRAMGFGHGDIIPSLAQRNKKVIVEEVVCSDDEYSKLDWITSAHM